MKKIITLFALVLSLTSLKAQFVTIPDANFVTWLQSNVPSAMSGNQMDTTSLAVTARNSIFLFNLGITDLTGIEYFKSLIEIHCTFNQLTNLPFLSNTVKYLYCNNNQIQYMSNIPSSIKILNCSYNMLTSLPMLPDTMDEFNCSNNNILCFQNIPYIPNEYIIGPGGGNIVVFDIDNNFFDCLPNYVPAMNSIILNYPLCNAGNINGCPISQFLTTSIKEYKGIQLLLSPNPSNGIFSIEISTNKNVIVQIINNLGEIALFQSVENGKAIIDASNLVEGVYYIKIKESDNNSVKKVVILN